MIYRLYHLVWLLIVAISPMSAVALVTDDKRLDHTAVTQKSLQYFHSNIEGNLQQFRHIPKVVQQLAKSKLRTMLRSFRNPTLNQAYRQQWLSAVTLPFHGLATPIELPLEQVCWNSFGTPTSTSDGNYCQTLWQGIYADDCWAWPVLELLKNEDQSVFSKDLSENAQYEKSHASLFHQLCPE